MSCGCVVDDIIDVVLWKKSQAASEAPVVIPVVIQTLLLLPALSNIPWEMQQGIWVYCITGY